MGMCGTQCHCNLKEGNVSSAYWNARSAVLSSGLCSKGDFGGASVWMGPVSGWGQHVHLVAPHRGCLL